MENIKRLHIIVTISHHFTLILIKKQLILLNICLKTFGCNPAVTSEGVLTNKILCLTLHRK